MTWRSAARPIKVLERELLKDIDMILDCNFQNPDILIAILYTLTLNQSHDCINDILFERIMLDYLLSDDCIKLMKMDEFDPTKGF